MCLWFHNPVWNIDQNIIKYRLNIPKNKCPFIKSKGKEKNGIVPVEGNSERAAIFQDGKWTGETVGSSGCSGAAAGKSQQRSQQIII